MLKVFCRFSLFQDCFEFRKFFSALYLNVIQIGLGWFSFVSGCYIGNFKMFMLCKFIEVVVGLLTRVVKILFEVVKPLLS